MIRINPDRLWRSLMAMATIGATARGGVCRLAGTDEDRRARDLFCRWCEEANCTVAVDGLGNIFARRKGRKSERLPVGLGSHLDSQPTGGKFDGALGVLAALEVVRSLNEHGVETDSAIEVIDWTNEEGSRFAPPMTCSAAYAGIFDPDYVKGRTDSDGRTLGDEIRRIGYVGEEPVGARKLAAYLELHIEQGPVLEMEGRQVGIVTGGQAQRWYEATVRGREAHSGTTPMSVRRDALAAAAAMIAAVRTIGSELPDAFATVGHVQVHPNSRNVVPGTVFFTVDCRHASESVLSELGATIERRLGEIASRADVGLELREIWRCPTTTFDPRCVEAVRNAAKELGFSSREMISGAGHDAINVASVAPTAMIFVPCRDGISHNEAEYASPEACAAGANVLLLAALALAGSG